MRRSSEDGAGSAMTPDSAGMETRECRRATSVDRSAMTPDSAGMETVRSRRRRLLSAMTPDSAGMGASLLGPMRDQSHRSGVTLIQS